MHSSILHSLIHQNPSVRDERCRSAEATLNDRRKMIAVCRPSSLGTDKKHYNMSWCLAEAILEVQREQCRTSDVFTLKHDTRDHHEMIRYSACDDKLRTSKGMFWLQPSGSKAPELHNAILQGLVQFCTPRGNAPFRAPEAPEPQCDNELLEWICDRVEMTASDNASNEVRATRMLRGRTPTSPGHLTTTFKNVRCHVPDVTHASVRMIKRPWAADPYLDSVMQTHIWGSGSIVCTIQFTNYQKKFASFAQDMESTGVMGTRIRDMNLAKHRFNSVTTPVGRFVLFFPVVWTLAACMLNRPAGDDCRQKAHDFFDTIDEDAVIQISMLADAADEHSAIVRFFDSEDYDVSEVPSALSIFLQKITMLFVADPPGCLTCKTYTNYMVELLQMPRICSLQTGIKQIGGAGRVTPQLLERCTQRMSNWVRLCNASIDAEFPSWKLTHAFQAFDLAAHENNLDHAKQIETSLERLAKVWDVNVKGLQHEMADFRPIARERYSSQGKKDSTDAWISVLQDMTSKRRSTQEAHPTRNLHPIVKRLAAFRGMTTSGVEQSFAPMKEVTRGARQKDSADMLNVEMRLVLESGINDAVIIDKARKIWCEVYNPPRASGTSRRPRMDKGVKRKFQDRCR